jgi:uncharacterized protein YbjT (DUF2867 family)
MIAVTCPTGRIAGLLVPRLCRRGHPVRVLCRAPSRADHLTALGVEMLKGSLFEPERLSLFLRDASACFLATPLLEDPRDERKLGRLVAAALLDTTVEHLVYLSVFDAAASSGAPLGTKAEVEETLADSGLDFTFLRPAYLMENLTYLQAEIEGGVLALPASPADPFPLVAAADVAAVALLALARGPAGIERIDLVAPDVLTPVEMAAVLAESLGHEVEAIEIGMPDYIRRLERAGVGAPRAAHLAGLAAHLAGAALRHRADLEAGAVLGAPAVTSTSFAAFAHEIAGERHAPLAARAYLTF